MGRPLIDLTGEKFGRLTVLKRGENEPRSNGSFQVRWICKCDCGNEVLVRAAEIKGGRTQSCGCLRNEQSSARAIEKFTKHGHNPAGKKSRTYQSWTNMMTRCYNPNVREYGAYGGRGIVVCDRWHQFENFLEDMGERPEGLTLDRKDVKGNYEPENCQWADRVTQSRNRMSTINVTVGDKTQCLKDWSEELSVPYTTLYRKYKRGTWP